MLLVDWKFKRAAAQNEVKKINEERAFN